MSKKNAVIKGKTPADDSAEALLKLNYFVIFTVLLWPFFARTFL